MKRGLIAVFTSALLFCGIGVAATVMSADEPAHNVPPEGFVALFNGKDLTGWKGLVGNPVSRAKMTPDELAAAQVKADAAAKEHWTVADGVLVYDGKNDNLCTAKDYGDFEMYVDWKIGPKGDTGIYLRGTPQVNIWDPSMHNGDGSGNLYNNKINTNKVLKLADKAPGEWNSMFIRMVGDRVTVKLNGELVVDDTPLENYWEPGKPLYETGAIELQHHGDQVFFRNIYIKELPR